MTPPEGPIRMGTRGNHLRRNFDEKALGKLAKCMESLNHTSWDPFRWKTNGKSSNSHAHKWSSRRSHFDEKRWKINEMIRNQRSRNMIGMPLISIKVGLKRYPPTQLRQRIENGTKFRMRNQRNFVPKCQFIYEMSYTKLVPGPFRPPRDEIRIDDLETQFVWRNPNFVYETNEIRWFRIRKSGRTNFV